ncbi:DNA invertase Pin-like site-specific DNA recombinase [Pseudomonas baetica]|uniref:DNA invertase Pin-like site-specific DNA recombinase n=1 Tax=Pseudomonas baetica TaxID=674054 RepID=A0ABX4Q431_9PSED|nr:recombinase family protein [Pseudomonas baetica]PKA71521.1 DNA invertase Pin-like site-specific DNA recombinase [Pseudomonas baetica]PTC20009.1 recombinase family protein [Pseudomonas baetica]
MAKNGARVYSYLRFSDPRQATGSSADRQLQYAQRWAAEKGLALDESLSLRDEGLSAYHQRHVKQGALGVFLQAVEDGRIADGSVLVVEGLDRLSRAEPIQAQAQLAQIINAGITVVTASDGREYNRAGLKAQPMDLVYSLLVMIRAHEESDTKSKRVKAAIRRQCEGWIAGTYRGIIRNGKDPQWLHWDGQVFQLLPERVEGVRLVIELFRQGYGSVRIIRELTERGLSVTTKGITALQVHRLVRLPALMGVKVLELDGETYRLEGYYPSILTADEFADLSLLVESRVRRKGKGEIPGLVTGLGITYCGYCGTAVVGQNVMHRAKADGSLSDGHRRLICVGYSHNKGCPVGGSCSVVPIEKALMSYCTDRMNLSSLLEGNDQSQLIQARLVAAKSEAANIEQQLERVSEALLAAEGGAAPLVFVRKARELEDLLSAKQKDIAQAERELVAVSNRDQPGLSEAWAELSSGVEMMDFDARMKVRHLVRDTFERIVVYHHGMQATARDGNVIDLLLVGKGGQPRLLRIDRKTGEWRAGMGA